MFSPGRNGSVPAAGSLGAGKGSKLAGCVLGLSSSRQAAPSLRQGLPTAPQPWVHVEGLQLISERLRNAYQPGRDFSCLAEMGWKLLPMGGCTRRGPTHSSSSPQLLSFPSPPFFCNSAVLFAMMKSILISKEKTDPANQSLFLELLGIGVAGG